MELYAELQQADMAEMSVRRFEHICRQIHMLTQKIISFKGGLQDDSK